MTYIGQDLSDTGLIGYRSTRRYYRTYTETGLPLGTTELIQNVYLFYGYRGTLRYYWTYTDTGLIRCMSTRRYYRTYTDAGLIKCRSTRRYYRTYSDTGVPVGTTELKQIQEYP